MEVNEAAVNANQKHFHSESHIDAYTPHTSGNVLSGKVSFSELENAFLSPRRLKITQRALTGDVITPKRRANRGGSC